MKIELITKVSLSPQQRLTDCSPGDCSPVNRFPDDAVALKFVDVSKVENSGAESAGSAR